MRPASDFIYIQLSNSRERINKIDSELFEKYEALCYYDL